MKQFIYLMGIALTLSATTVAQSHSPLHIRKATDKQRKELKMQRRAPLHRAAPLAGQRIQPAAAECYIGTEPPQYYKYNAWGNTTEYTLQLIDSDGSYIPNGFLNQCYTWDNSKGYPILLDYYCNDSIDDVQQNLTYGRRTTLNAEGVRTSIEVTDWHFVLDAAGRVTTYNYTRPSSEITMNTAMTWNGDALTSYQYNYENSKTGLASHIKLNNIRIVYQSQPFNAYDEMYNYLFNEPQSDGVWMSAEGEANGVPMEVRTKVSEDKKTITIEQILQGTTVIYKNVTVFTDDNGSYRTTEEDAYGYKNELSYTYNQYGDMTFFYEKTEENGVVRTISYRNKWEYEDGKPLQVKVYTKENDAEEELDYLMVYTAWHNGNSISATSVSESRILGAILYTIDGTKVRTLTAEEAQALETVTVPQRGIYLLRVQTDKGIETRKVIL